MGAMHCGDGAHIRSRHTAKGIMRLACCTVEAQRDALDTGGLDCVKVRVDQPRRGRGAQPDMQSRRSRLAHQIKGITAHQRITTGENEHRWIQLRQLPDQAACFPAIQFIRVAVRLRLSPAVPASERTGPGDLPEHQERTFIKALIAHGGDS